MCRAHYFMCTNKQTETTKIVMTNAIRQKERIIISNILNAMYVPHSCQRTLLGYKSSLRLNQVLSQDSLQKTP